MNKIILIGNIGGDLELKSTEKTAVVNFNLATNEYAKEGKKTQWHRIVCYGQLAERAAKGLCKGSKCVIEGRVQSRIYVDKSGIEKHIFEVIGQNLEFLDPAPQKSSELFPKTEYPLEQPLAASNLATSQATTITEDEIPF